MQLCLDVGNTNILGGVFSGDDLLLTFRHDTRHASTSDQIGLFMKQVLRENNINPNELKQIAFCSVVPALDYSLRGACAKYFGITAFALKPNAKTGLTVRCYNPEEIGADRLANAIAAVSRFPKQNLFIIDFGTATTCCAVTAKNEYWGGAIMPGMRLTMESLQHNAAMLFPVELAKPKVAVGKSTAENLQSGLYYMQLGAIKELITRFEREIYQTKPLIIATGGFAHLFADEKIFDVIIPDLVLRGLQIALSSNG